MTFEGNNLSLVCYHGINLRSKSWVVFIMQEPGVSFSTEAQQVISEGMYLYVVCYAQLDDYVELPSFYVWVDNYCSFLYAP